MRNYKWPFLVTLAVVGIGINLLFLESPTDMPIESVGSVEVQEASGEIAQQETAVAEEAPLPQLVQTLPLTEVDETEAALNKLGLSMSNSITISVR